jgi:spore coat protein H
LYSCKNVADVEPSLSEKRAKLYPDWTAQTHQKLDEGPNYQQVFPQDQVNTINITITKARWDSVFIDMTKLAGSSFGTKITTMPPVGGALDIIPGDPKWFRVTVNFNNKNWYQVGFRLKGNSSLKSSWERGIYKLPFKLQFDEFEAEEPLLDNQRFFGFKEFSMSPAYGDNSFIREKLASDLFIEAKVPAANTAFYKIYLDRGDGKGLVYFGLYTMVEVIDDSAVKHHFKEEKGNIYKPESDFRAFNLAKFEKKNNTTENNFTDVQQTIAALNSPLRTSDPITWRNNLNKVFDTDAFLQCQIVNNTMVNWDTYGAIAHNYYTYTPTTTGKVTWIPWDLNLSMTTTGLRTATSLGMKEVGTNWPLINFMANDPVYYANYIQKAKAYKPLFTAQRIHAIIDKYDALIKPAVDQELAPYTHLSNKAAYGTAVTNLKTHITSREKALADFIQAN